MSYYNLSGDPVTKEEGEAIIASLGNGGLIQEETVGEISLKALYTGIDCIGDRHHPAIFELLVSDSAGVQMEYYHSSQTSLLAHQDRLKAELVAVGGDLSLLAD